MPRCYFWTPVKSGRQQIWGRSITLSQYVPLDTCPVCYKPKWNNLSYSPKVIHTFPWLRSRQWRINKLVGHPATTNKNPEYYAAQQATDNLGQRWPQVANYWKMFPFPFPFCIIVVKKKALIVSPSGFLDDNWQIENSQKLSLTFCFIRWSGQTVIRNCNNNILLKIK